ncbi:transposase family Tnp2 protein, partial [Rhizoctonia solani 123E]
MLLRPSFVSALKSGNEAHSSHRHGILDDLCCGTVYKSAQIGLRQVFCINGTVQDEPVTPNSARKLKDLDFELYLAINIDWFRSTPKSIESTGAIYITIQNLDHTVCFSPANVILACIVPGPKEPPLEELNWVLQPIVDEIKQLYAGIVMNTHNSDHPEPKLIHAQLVLTAADTPARCKCQGTAGHAHNKRPCRCNVEKKDINLPKGYDIANLDLIDEDMLLGKAYESKLARTKAASGRIHTEFGIRWSALNELPDWKPHSSAPVDLMHNLFL